MSKRSGGARGTASRRVEAVWMALDGLPHFCTRLDLFKKRHDYILKSFCYATRWVAAVIVVVVNAPPDDD